jgi:hypothetical protein
MTREEFSERLSELQSELRAAEQELLLRRPLAAEEWNALLRALRGDMSVLAERIKNGEVTDVEMMAAADILLHPDIWPKHSFENMVKVERDRDIAETVNFIADRDGEKMTNVVEQWATKEYGLKRSAIWESIRRGRLLLRRK